MSILTSGLLGALQGLTEFIPISSSGHLIVFRELFHIEFQNDLAFDVALHFGTLIALLIVFRQSLVKLAIDFFRRRSPLPMILLVGTIPIIIFGVFFEQFLEASVRDIRVVLFSLVAVGILMVIIDHWSKESRSLSDLSLKDGIMIGIAQAFALIPGTSRSGITIITGLFLSLKRKDAAEFSFLLAIPAVLASAGKVSFDLWQANAPIPSGQFFIGMISSAAVGIFCLRFFLHYLKSHSLALFGWYRIIFGLFISLFLL